MSAGSREDFERNLRPLLSKGNNLQVEFIPGDPSQPSDLRVLEKIPHPISVIIVLANSDMDDQQADARSIVTVLLLRQLFKEVHGTRPRIVAEILDSKSRSLLEQDIGAEFVLSVTTTARILTQLSEQRGMGAVLGDLFASNGQGNELFLRPAECYLPLDRPQQWVAVESLARLYGETAIGWFRPSNKHISLNPPRSGLVTLQARDQIIVIGDSPNVKTVF